MQIRSLNFIDGTSIIGKLGPFRVRRNESEECEAHYARHVALQALGHLSHVVAVHVMWRRNEHLGECVLRLQFQRSAESDIIVSVRAKRVFRVGERVNRRLMNAPGPKQSQNRQRLRA